MSFFALLSETFQIARQALAANRMRSLLALLGIVIGTTARRVAREQALSHVAGYVLANRNDDFQMQYGGGVVRWTFFADRPVAISTASYLAISASSHATLLRKLSVGCSRVLSICATCGSKKSAVAPRTTLVVASSGCSATRTVCCITRCHRRSSSASPGVSRWVSTPRAEPPHPC